MEAKVKWQDGLRFVAESASGHQVIMDGRGENRAEPNGNGLMARAPVSAIDGSVF